jgi:phage recombination protein Bet
MVEAKEEKTIATYEARDGQEIKLSIDTVRKLLVSGNPQFVTDAEIMLYIGMCKARGLNPFKKDCYLVKYTQGDPASTIVSIDYYRARARAQKDCKGWQCGIIVRGKDGNLQQREGSFIEEDEKLLGAWFLGQPEGWTKPLHWTINLSAFIKKTKEGTPTRFWSVDNQPGQIVKVCESQGLRKLWPDEFQGLMTAGEIELDITPEPTKPVYKQHEEKAALDHQTSYKGQLEACLLQAGGNSNVAKALLKELTGKTFISNVSETEAKAALEKFAEHNKATATEKVESTDGNA